jgi:hypothetical protein
LELIELLESPVVDNVLSNFWKGPYEQTGSPMEQSVSFKVLRSVLWDKNTYNCEKLIRDKNMDVLKG